MASVAEPYTSSDVEAKSPKAETDGPTTYKPQKEKKIGHRRVDAATGQTTYKKTPSSALSSAIQLGISHAVGGITSKPERDVLMQDFQVVETTVFPSEGSNTTPAHHFDDFRFKTYAPVAFRYFRELFGILPEDYMLSISKEPLVELSNPGASGSLFFVTHDDEFIIKTVQHKEAQFLQELLPGYYMNLVQNPRTLLPKFYGLYCIQAGGKNIRMVVMNNLLPRHLEMHMKFDLKGSTYKRKASKAERAKRSPTYKDLDMLHDIPEGLTLEPEIHALLMKTMQRDCLVLRSFKIMDYSLLLGVHYPDKDKPSSDRGSSSQEDFREKRKSVTSDFSAVAEEKSALSRTIQHKKDHKRSAYSDSILSATLLRDKYTSDLELWSGGIPATSPKGEKLLLFCGIIDILQCYKLKKKLEHTWKAMVHDADSVSVHRPGFYCERFQKFMSEHVFRKTIGPIRQQPSKKRAQTTRKLADGTSGVNKSPLTRTRMSPAHAGGLKLTGRPDLLPSESPRPTNHEQGNNALKSSQHINSPAPVKIGDEEKSTKLKLIAQDSNPVTTRSSTQRMTGKKEVSSFLEKASSSPFQAEDFHDETNSLHDVNLHFENLEEIDNAACGEPSKENEEIIVSISSTETEIERDNDDKITEETAIGIEGTAF